MTAAVAPLPKRQNEPNWSQLLKRQKERKKENEKKKRERERERDREKKEN